jgi:hypothetical protein
MKNKIDIYYKRAYAEVVKDYYGKNLNLESEELTFRTKETLPVKIVEIINRAVLDFENESERLNYQVTLRSDALYFILINFDMMVYRPLKIVIEEPMLIQHIYEDIGTILRASLFDKIKRDNSASKEIEISGHDVVNAGVKNWQKLKTLYNDSW